VSPREREELRILRDELRPLGVRLRLGSRGGLRHYRLTAGERVLFSTTDRLSALAFGAGVAAGAELRQR